MLPTCLDSAPSGSLSIKISYVPPPQDNPITQSLNQTQSLGRTLQKLSKWRKVKRTRINSKKRWIKGSGMAQWLYAAVTRGPERRFKFSEV